MISFCFTLLGLVLGSYINAAIYRFRWHRDRELLSMIPAPSDEIALKEKTLTAQISRGSHCDHCQTALPLYALIPVMSYLMFLGKSCCCKKRLPIKYPLIELSCGLWMAAVSVFPIDLNTQITVALFGIGLIGLALCDIEYKLISDEHIDLLLLCALCYLLTLPMILSQFIIGYIVFYLVLKLLSKSFFMLYKKDCFGEGDVKVGAIIGLFHGIYDFSSLLLIASISCLFAYCIVYLKKRSCTMELPFLPFLNGASLLLIIKNFGGLSLL